MQAISLTHHYGYTPQTCWIHVFHETWHRHVILNLWARWGESKSLHHHNPFQEVQVHPLAYGFKMFSWQYASRHGKCSVGYWCNWLVYWWFWSIFLIMGASYSVPEHHSLSSSRQPIHHQSSSMWWAVQETDSLGYWITSHGIKPWNNSALPTSQRWGHWRFIW